MSEPKFSRLDLIPNGENNATTYLALGLQVLVDTQRQVSSLVDGATDLPLTKEQVSTVAFALVQEIGELANEIGWKPWKQVSRDEYAIVDEFADVLAFLGLLIYYITDGLGITPQQLVTAYVNKSLENVSRFIGRAAKPNYGVNVTPEKIAKAWEIANQLNNYHEEPQPVQLKLFEF